MSATSSEEIRPTPTRVPGTDIRVPKSIRDTTNEILGRVDPSIPIVVVAQVLHDGDRPVVKGAIYHRIGEELSFVAFATHNLKRKGLKFGAELRWTP